MVSVNTKHGSTSLSCLSIWYFCYIVYLLLCIHGEYIISIWYLFKLYYAQHGLASVRRLGLYYYYFLIRMTHSGCAYIYIMQTIPELTVLFTSCCSSCLVMFHDYVSHQRLVHTFLLLENFTFFNADYIWLKNSNPLLLVWLEVLLALDHWAVGYVEPCHAYNHLCFSKVYLKNMNN